MKIEKKTYGNFAKEHQQLYDIIRAKNLTGLKKFIDENPDYDEEYINAYIYYHAISEENIEIMNCLLDESEKAVIKTTNNTNVLNLSRYEYRDKFEILTCGIYEASKGSQFSKQTAEKALEITQRLLQHFKAKQPELFAYLCRNILINFSSNFQGSETELRFIALLINYNLQFSQAETTKLQEGFVDKGTAIDLALAKILKTPKEAYDPRAMIMLLQNGAKINDLLLSEHSKLRAFSDVIVDPVNIKILLIYGANPDFILIGSQNSGLKIEDENIKSIIKQAKAKLETAQNIVKYLQTNKSSDFGKLVQEVTETQKDAAFKLNKIEVANLIHYSRSNLWPASEPELSNRICEVMSDHLRKLVPAKDLIKKIHKSTIIIPTNDIEANLKKTLITHQISSYALSLSEQANLVKYYGNKAHLNFNLQLAKDHQLTRAQILLGVLYGEIELGKTPRPESVGLLKSAIHNIDAKTIVKITEAIYKEESLISLSSSLRLMKIVMFGILLLVAIASVFVGAIATSSAFELGLGLIIGGLAIGIPCLAYMAMLSYDQLKPPVLITPRIEKNLNIPQTTIAGFSKSAEPDIIYSERIVKNPKAEIVESDKRKTVL